MRVVVIALLAYASVRATALVVRRFEHEVASGSSLDALERGKRARTLGAAVSKVTTVLIVGIAVLMILQQFSIDIAPVLTGAGIAGLAVGFGAQTLVRDVISGFFLLLEDQVRVGDVAAINGTGGLVEQLNLRTIVLRDAEGTVHVFPNGAITTLANKSKDFSYYVIDLRVSYREDPDRVAAILREVGGELQADPAYGPFILAPLEIHGRGRVRRLVDGDEDADQDRAAQAVGRRTRAAQAHQEGVRRARASRCRLRRSRVHHGRMPARPRAADSRRRDGVSSRAAVAGRAASALSTPARS